MFITQLEYIKIIIIIFISIIFVCIIVIFAYVISNKWWNKEKNSPYECGFEPFDNARSKLNIHFYIIGMLFIIFDLELVYVFPWILILQKIEIINFFTMTIFLLILLIGFIYEWKKKILSWK